MRWFEAIPGILILCALAWFAGWVLWFLVYAPIRAYLDVKHGKPGRCHVCKAEYNSSAVVLVDQMYASTETRIQCPNGHVARHGSRRFAEW